MEEQGEEEGDDAAYGPEDAVHARRVGEGDLGESSRRVLVVDEAGEGLFGVRQGDVLVEPGLYGYGVSRVVGTAGAVGTLDSNNKNLYACANA